MNADAFNAAHPVGTPVFAYPGARPEDFPSDRRLITRTRSVASVLGGHTDVVWVDGHSACIALSHVDVVSEDEFKAARAAETAAAVAEQGALPMPVGTGSLLSERERLRAAFVAALDTAHETQPCSCGSQIWSSCYHPDSPGRTHEERRADAVLAVRDAEVEWVLAEADRLQRRVDEVEADRAAAQQALRVRDGQLARLRDEMTGGLR